MKNKIMGLLAAVLLGSSMAVAVGSPAQAWGYCHGGNPPSVNGQLNGYYGQGYCSNWESLPFTPGACMNLGAPYIPANWMAAVWNRTLWSATLFERPDCDYINGPYKTINANSSSPDLYPFFLGRNVSSVRWGSS